MGRAPSNFFKLLADVVAQALTELSETVSCASVANYFLEKASREGRALTALQVNYLLYLTQGWHLAYFDKPLLNEVFLAGRQGIQSMHFHRALAKWGSQGIREPFRSGPRPWDVEFAPNLPAEGMAFLDALWNAYASFGATNWPGCAPQPIALGHAHGRAAKIGR